MQVTEFQTKLVDWYEKYGRKNLPWQVDDSYCVWISEIMLQQTQVNSVIGYYQKFIQRFPTLEKCANADIDEVLSHWSGLGYYNRARNIHKTAMICMQQYQGELPKDLQKLMTLPGIGRTTAGAILSLSYNLPFPILDGNVKRVVSRVFAIKADKPSHLINKLWAKVTQLMPKTNARKYNQALMDLGSMVCKRSKPECDNCPFNKRCKALQSNQIALYPQKNKKTKQVEQTLHALLVKNKDTVFLQQRDDKSIWPHLWFLPLFSSNQNLTNTITLQHGKIMGNFSVMHILTHRKLNIKVTVIECQKVSSVKGSWQKFGNIKNLAHPKALNKILKNITFGT
jgi:A/G-specific adenine glycosylase